MKRHAPEILKVQEGVCRVLESVIIEMLVLPPKIILKVFSLLFFVGRLQSINIYIHMLKEIKSNYHSVYLSKQQSESKYIWFSVRMKNNRRLSDDSV